MKKSMFLKKICAVMLVFSLSFGTVAYAKDPEEVVETITHENQETKANTNGKYKIEFGSDNTFSAQGLFNSLTDLEKIDALYNQYNNVQTDNYVHRWENRANALSILQYLVSGATIVLPVVGIALKDRSEALKTSLSVATTITGLLYPFISKGQAFSDQKAKYYKVLDILVQDSINKQNAKETV